MCIKKCQYIRWRRVMGMDSEIKVMGKFLLYFAEDLR